MALDVPVSTLVYPMDPWDVRYVRYTSVTRTTQEADFSSTSDPKSNGESNDSSPREA